MYVVQSMWCNLWGACNLYGAIYVVQIRYKRCLVNDLTEHHRSLDTLKTLWALSRHGNGEEEEDYVSLVDRAAPDRSSNAGQLGARVAPEHLVLSLVS